MVIEGDFVPGVVATQDQGRSRSSDYNVPVPVDRRLRRRRSSAAATSIVMFKDTPAARALVKYLATPEAATIWAKRGGFSSPNKGVPASAYPDAITRATATALAQAEDVPLRHVRPRAGGVRRHAGPGRVEDPAGLPREARRTSTAPPRSSRRPRRRRTSRSSVSTREHRLRSPPSRGLRRIRRAGALAARTPVTAAVPRAGADLARASGSSIRSSTRSWPQPLRPRRVDNFVWLDNYKDALHDRHAHARRSRTTRSGSPSCRRS